VNRTAQITPPPEQTGWRREFLDGIKLVARHRGVQLIVVMSASVTFTSAFLVAEPLYARHVLPRPPSQFALFEAASGTGDILASLAIPASRTDSPGAGSWGTRIRQLIVPASRSSRLL
jgi:hypothetical protein